QLLLRNGLVLGAAIADWFEIAPRNALNSIDGHLMTGPPLYFEEILFKMAALRSSEGFLQTLEKVKHHEDPLTRGEVILRLEKHYALLSITPILFDFSAIALAERISSIEVGPEQRKPINEILELLKKQAESR
ncbi:hypothetical protein N9A94_07215, partial [Akkermansiaceae bacterium]|nr:hypothetical protein [Akkermansiaceae bacterium]